MQLGTANPLAGELIIELLVCRGATHGNALRRNGNHAHHRLPVLLLLRVDDPAFPRRHDVSRLDLEPPTIASELIGLSEPPLATRPPHEQVSVVIICVIWPIVDRVRLWHEEAQLVCVQAVRDTVAVRIHHEHERPGHIGHAVTVLIHLGRIHSCLLSGLCCQDFSHLHSRGVLGSVFEPRRHSMANCLTSALLNVGGKGAQPDV